MAHAPSMTENAPTCEACGFPEQGAMVPTGTGRMHRACWDERYPWRPAHTFAEVIGSKADHVLVRALLAAMIPRETQRLIVRAYNTHMSERIRKSTLSHAPRP